jgi:hypothetical protein
LIKVHKQMATAKPSQSCKKVEMWLRRQGFRSRAAKTHAAMKDATDFDRRVVTYNANSSTRTRLCTLLHEAGHVLIYRSRLRRPQNLVHGRRLADMNVVYKKATKQQKLQIMDEEIAAWERGWKLGRRLKLRVARGVFDTHQTRSLMTYVRWVVKP